MAEAITLYYQSQTKGEQTLDESAAPATSASNRKVTHSGFDTAKTLNGSSTPPVTKMAAFDQALIAAEATIDLTELTGTNGAAVDAAGLRVQCLKLRNPSGNSAAMTISKGASDGYDGFGSSFSVAVPVGGEVTIFANDAGSDIGSANKILDLAGTGAEQCEIIIFMG